MQKRLLLREVLELLILSVAACALLLFPETASAAVVRGLRQCGAAILPSLFPFFICANLITELSLTRIPARLLGRLMRPVFHLGGAGSAALVLGLVGGYPAGAQAVAQLYEGSSISQEEAGRLLLFCNNAGPAFVTGVCGVCVLGSAKAGLLLYAVHAFCALLTGVLLRGPLPDAAPPAAHTSPGKAPGFAAAFITSVKRAGTTALQVCMFVVAFSVLSAFLLCLLPEGLPPEVRALLVGMLELSNGVLLLDGCRAAFPIAAFLLGFSGLSVCAQAQSLLAPAGLGLGQYLPAKLLHGTLSALLALLLSALHLLPEAAAAGAFPASLPLLPLILPGWLLLGIICLRFRKLSSGNSAQKRV